MLCIPLRIPPGGPPVLSVPLGSIFKTKSLKKQCVFKQNAPHVEICLLPVDGISLHGMLFVKKTKGFSMISTATSILTFWVSERLRAKLHGKITIGMENEPAVRWRLGEVLRLRRRLGQ